MQLIIKFNNGISQYNRDASYQSLTRHPTVKPSAKRQFCDIFNSVTIIVHSFLLYVKPSTVELVELFALSLRYRKVQFHENTQEIRYKQTKRQLNGGSMSVVRLMCVVEKNKVNHFSWTQRLLGSNNRYQLVHL